MNDMKEAIEVLKTAIMAHLLAFNGPTPRLCQRLLKIVDLIEDTDMTRKYQEIGQLADLICNDILEEEKKWHDSNDPSSMSAQTVRQALESTTMNTRDRLAALAKLAKLKALHPPE